MGWGSGWGGAETDGDIVLDAEGEVVTEGDRDREADGDRVAEGSKLHEVDGVRLREMESDGDGEAVLDSE